MSSPDWPAPEQPQQSQQRSLPLPRIEDLPVAEQGYDREAVGEAFDAFYRHAAQLDATLRTLEAVEVFQRTASELRAELRTVRAAGWTVSGYGYQRGSGGYGGVRSTVREWSLPPAFPRVAAEALFLIVVGVIVGVAGWSRIAIVLVMALALAIVWLVEWVAARERAIPQATAAPPAAPRLDEAVEEPAELPAAPDAAGWSAFTEHEEGPEAMTMLSAEAVRVEAEEPPAEEALVAEEEAPPEPDAVPELVPVAPTVTPMPVPVAPEPDEEEEELEPVAAALEDPVPVEPPPDEDPVPVEAPPDEDPVPVDEPAEEDEVAAVAGAAEPDDADAAGVVEDVEPEDAVAEVAEPEAPAERRRFRFWRRGAVPAEQVADVAVPDPEPQPEPVDELVEPVAEVGSGHVDPWEREPELPDVVVAEAEVEEPEELVVEGVDEPEVEPEKPRSHGWFRRAFSNEVVAEPEPTVEEDAEPVEQAFDEGDEVDDGVEELGDELAAGSPWAQPLSGAVPEDEVVPEPEPEPEPRELPVEVLSEQAEAALARSRARRRPPRRARRR